MANVRQLKDHGAPIFPITHVSLVKGMEYRALMDATYAWDGTGTPDVSKIPAGVVVTYNGTDYTGTLVASASTTGRFYLVPSTTVQGEWDRYMTDGSGSSYAWKAAGNTSIPSPAVVDNETTDDPTKPHSAAGGKRLKDQLGELEAEVHQLAGKYYGVFADDSDLPEGDAVGYAFVGTEAPFAIWNFDGEEWADSGATVEGITGEPGVGFDSVTTQEDGSLVIHLTNGDTITIDLTHNHPDYYSKVVGTSQPSGGFLPDVAYNLGEISGTVAFILASAVTGKLNHYFWMFDTGSTAPTITWPTGITWASGSAPTVVASKHYEVSILGGIAYYSEV